MTLDYPHMCGYAVGMENTNPVFVRWAKMLKPSDETFRALVVEDRSPRVLLRDVRPMSPGSMFHTTLSVDWTDVVVVEHTDPVLVGQLAELVAK